MGWGIFEGEVCGVLIEIESVVLAGLGYDGQMFSPPYDNSTWLGQISDMCRRFFQLAGDPLCVIGDEGLKHIQGGSFGNRNDGVGISDTDVAMLEAGFTVEGIIKRMDTIIKTVVGNLSLHRSGSRG